MFTPVAEMVRAFWFTVSAPTALELESFLKDVKEKSGVTDILDMRAVRTFKINASFEV